jgi:cytochrome c-type biogenesis protein CcmH
MLGVAPWIFWATCTGLAGMVAAILWMAFRRGSVGATDRAGFDVQVYRDQLAEVDRDTARGVIAPEEAERMRTEISRRLLEADRMRASQTEVGSAGQGSRALLVGLASLATIGTFGLYWHLGAPGYPDMPLRMRMMLADELRETRPGQAEAEAAAAAETASGTDQAEAPAPDAQYLELIEKLRQTVAERPDDLRGQELLARNEAALGNFQAAYAAQRRVIELKGTQVLGEDHAILAELMILAAGGYVSPEAEAELTKAVTIEPSNGTARYYSGLMLAQIGRPDLAFQIWRNLLENSAPDAPWMAPLRDQIGDLAQSAGVEYAPPAALSVGRLRGPDGEDVGAAAEMNAQDRAAFIRNMVEQLSDRLAGEGGTAEEWAQLITALNVLGETDRARAIWTEAEGRFAEREDDMALLRAAARQAGLIE